jgi:hypothetical protein
MRFFLLLPLVFLLSACGVSSSDGVVARGANTSGFMGLSENDAVQIDGASSMTGIRNVVIGSFKVGFIDSSQQHKKAKSGILSSGIGGNATGNVKLEGISPQVKKDVTEAAYNDFVSKLTANGFNVVSRSTLTSSTQYQNASKTDFPYVDDTSAILSSYGQTVYYLPSSLGSQGIMLMNDVPGSNGFAGLGSADSKMADFASKNNIAVVSATYLIDFAAAGGHESVMSASVKVGQNLAVTQGTVKFVRGGTSSFTNGTPTVSLGQPVESGKEFGTVIDDSSTAGIAVQEAANVVGVLLGGGTNRYRDYIIQADPVRYKAQTVEVLSRANTTMLSKAGVSK